MFLSIINPILAAALIILLLIGTNLGLRILAKVSSRNIASYLVFVGLLFVLGGLWFFSVLTTVQAGIIFAAVAVGYLIVSMARGGSWPS